MKRIALLDEIRGFCVLCMILYHGLDILFRVGDWALCQNLYQILSPLEPFYAATFILLCGISSRLSRSNLRRGLKLGAIALSISVVTLWVLPKFQITGVKDYFGILHLLALCILLFHFWEKVLSKLPPTWGVLLFGASFMIAALFTPCETAETNLFFWLGFHNEHFFSADYFPLLPFGFVFFVGTYLGSWAKEGAIPDWMYPRRVPVFDWLGTHALLLYVTHVPVLYGLSKILLFLF